MTRPSGSRTCSWPAGGTRRRRPFPTRSSTRSRCAGRASGATALGRARERGRGLVVDVNEAGAKATVEQIEKAGGQAAAARADVTRAADNQAVVERATAQWGRLDVFYANAGVPQWKTDLEDVD